MVAEVLSSENLVSAFITPKTYPNLDVSIAVLAQGYCHCCGGSSKGAMLSDEQSLFGIAMKDNGNKEGGNAERATKLRRYDHVSAQAVNPHGSAPIVNASMAQVWTSIKTGNKKVMFFSEFVSMDKHRRGIAISRMAECLLACFDVIEKPVTAQLLQEGPLNRAKEEVAHLKPHLQVLYGGKTKSASTSLSSIGSDGVVAKQEAVVNTAAAALYD